MGKQTEVSCRWIDIYWCSIINFMVITASYNTKRYGYPGAACPSPDKQQNQELENKTVVVQVLKGDKLKINNEDANWDTLGRASSRCSRIAAEKSRLHQGLTTMCSSCPSRAPLISCAEAGIDKVGLINRPSSKQGQYSSHQVFRARMWESSSQGNFASRGGLMEGFVVVGRRGDRFRYERGPVIDILLCCWSSSLIIPHQKGLERGRLPQQQTDRPGALQATRSDHRSD